MQLSIVNLTGSIKTYLSGAVSVPANSTLAIIDQKQQLALATDAQLHSDLGSGFVQMSDSITQYGPFDSLDFLKIVLQRLISLNDGVGNSLTSTSISTKQALDVAPITSSDLNGSGSISALNAAVVANLNGCSTIVFNLSGTWSASLNIEATADNTNWFSINGISPPSDTISTVWSSNTNIVVACGSYKAVRLRAFPYTSGTANITWNSSIGQNVFPVFTTSSSALNAQVVGNVGSLTADSGNPVKIGTVYNSSLPTPSSGQRVDSQANQFAETTIQYRNKYYNHTGNATHTVKSGSGRLHGIMVNRNWTGGTVTVYDNTAGSGTIIATIDFGSPSGGLLSTSGIPGPIMVGPLGLEFTTGLTVVSTGSTSNNITLLYQ